MHHRRLAYTSTLALVLLLSHAACAATERPEWQIPEWQIGENVVVDDVFPGLYVQFDLLTHGDQQFVAYYNADRQMTIAQRTLGSDAWSYTHLDEHAGWDSHNYVTIDADDDGYLHVSGNMHNNPMVYFRSEQPADASSLQRRFPMADEPTEQLVTYPEFLRSPDGHFVFSYRDGGSGDGNVIYNIYDHDTRQWSRLFDEVLLDGQGQYNAYPVGPDVGPDGYAHLVWVWRDTPDAATNHTLSYARSSNLVDWEHADGTPVELPMTIDTGDVVDPVQARQGMINNNTHVGFDAQDRTLVTYHKFDDDGNTQLFIARHEHGQWQVHQASDWDDFRWEFGGGGTLDFELTLSSARPGDDGVVILDYMRLDRGEGRLLLDEDTLERIDDIERPRQYPSEITDLRSDFPDMRVRTQAGAIAQNERRYLLRWETVPEMRDQALDDDQYPSEPSTLEVYRLVRPQ